MIKRIETDDPELFAVKISEQLTRNEFLQVKPEIEKIISQYGKFRLLIEASDLKLPEFSFFMEDFKFIIHNHKNAERVALIGNKTWEKVWLEFVKLITSVDVLFFDVSERERAWEWIKSR